ncbi:uncharacterized protein METZ01_LOCUS425897, partial [marine metagenome]
GQVSSRTAYCGHISQPYAGLTDTERVGRRRNLPTRHMGLEVSYAGYGQVDIITPSSNNRVRLHTSVATLFEEVEEGFPHCILEGLSSHWEAPYRRVANEGVRVLCRIATSGATGISRPEARTGDPTGLADVS